MILLLLPGNYGAKLIGVNQKDRGEVYLPARAPGRLALLGRRVPARMAFKKIVKEGGAERLAGMMVADGNLYSGALGLLANPDWSVRMGKML